MNDSYIPRVLSLDETETLVKMCYYREMAAIKHARYRRSTDQANDMRACNAALAAAKVLLNQEKDDAAYTDPNKEEARQALWQCVRGGLRMGIENIRNMTLRLQYIGILKENVLAFIRQLSQTAAADTAGVARIAHWAADARNSALTLTRAKLSKTARAFSQMLKEQGLSLAQLRTRYTERLFGAGRSFGSLPDALKADVYEDIIKASGRANVKMNIFSGAMAVWGAATVILLLGCVVWDVVESSNPTLTFVQNAVTLGAGFAGATVGAEFGASVGAAGGPPGVFVGGLLGGIIGGLGIGMAAESIFDAMVAAFSGDIPDELTNHSIWGIRFFMRPRCLMAASSPPLCFHPNHSRWMAQSRAAAQDVPAARRTS